LVRPLFWAELDNKELWEVEDAFLLGDNLLVAPVLEEGMKRRRIALPHGDWFCLWNESTYTGPGSIDVETPLDQIPILVRAGSLLPMAEEGCLNLHIYPDLNKPDQTLPQLLYNDAGEGYGDWRLDSFYMRYRENRLEIAWECEGEYPFPYQLVRLHMYGFHAVEAWVDNQATPIVENVIETAIFHRVLIKT
jgi:alpha-glucosidase